MYERIKNLCEELEIAEAGEHKDILLKLRDAVENALPAASLEEDNARLQRQNAQQAKDLAEAISAIEMLKREIEKFKAGNVHTGIVNVPESESEE